jgi:hypothetical protein
VSTEGQRDPGYSRKDLKRPGIQPALERLSEAMPEHWTCPGVIQTGANNLRDAEVQLEQVRAVEAPGVTHLKYRSVK